MPKSVDEYGCDGSRIFIKGMEITDLLKHFKIKTETKMMECTGVGFGSVPIGTATVITMTLHHDNIVATHDAIYIGDIPTKEFIAEMVKLRLQR